MGSNVGFSPLYSMGDSVEIGETSMKLGTGVGGWPHSEITGRTTDLHSKKSQKNIVIGLCSVGRFTSNSELVQ